MFGVTNILLLLPVYTFARCNSSLEFPLFPYQSGAEKDGHLKSVIYSYTVFAEGFRYVSPEQGRVPQGGERSYGPTGNIKDFDLTVTLKNPPDSRVKGQCKQSHQGDTYHSFTSIPFAEPPVGGRRLQKPEPVRPWNGTYDATRKDKLCPQDSLLQGQFIVGTEDCLYLNVYTPVVSKNSSKLLPVLFWIHGGGFQFGSGIHMLLGYGFFDEYDPAFFMDEEIVVVTPNYRLGALGFLTTEDDVIPANLGLRDQVLALKWVQDNIDLFGGNPKDIVIIGESAGSASVGYHLLSNKPEIKAVTGAIMISGTCLSPWALVTNATANAFEVGRKLGSDYSSDRSSASLLRVLQNTPTETFLRAAGMRYIPAKTDDGSPGSKWSPTFAKDFYPAEPMTDAVDQGRFHKVPLLFGVNSEECLSPIFLEFLPQIYRKAKVWDEDPSKMIAKTFNVRDARKAGADIKAIYTNSSFSEDIAALIKYCTDDQFTLPVGRHAESASKYGVPVYMYQMAYQYIPHFIPGIEGLGHAEDMFFYWDTFITKVLKLIFPNYGLVSRRMVRLLSNFVKYKKPVVGKEELFQNLAWPKFESKGLQYMKIDTEVAVHFDIRNYSSKRIVWDRHVQEPISIY